MNNIRQRGFSLVELMVVTGVMAFLSIIAIPHYSAFLIRSNRNQVEQVLFQNQQYLERIYSEKGSYLNGRNYVDLPYIKSPIKGDQLYQISFLNMGSPSPHSYILIATPVIGTVQAGDGSICVDSEHNLYEYSKSYLK